MTDDKKDDLPASLTFYPFAYALFNEDLSNHCWYCLDESTSLKQCAGCSTAQFCDKNCQRLGWKDHKVECGALKSTKAIGGEVPDIEVRLLGRIVCRHRMIKMGKDKSDPDFYTDRQSKRSIMDIWSHTESVKQDAQAMKKFDDIFNRLTAFYGPTALLDRDEIFELHCRDFINRHAISDRMFLTEIGKGLYLDLCQYDHSCAPNAIYTCQGFVATMRPLTNGVDLRDLNTTHYSYIDLLNSKQERRKMLMDTWYFKCECTRCMDNGEHILTAMLCPNCPFKIGDQQRLCLFGEWPYKDRISQIITCPSQKCLSNVKQEKVAEAIEAMRFIGRILDHNELDQMDTSCAKEFLTDLIDRFKTLLPTVNVFYTRLLQAQLSRTDSDDQIAMLDIHMATKECLIKCFPNNHPSIAMHLRNIAVFNRNLGNTDEAIGYVKEAMEMLNVALGEEHPLTKETNDLLKQYSN